MRIYYDSLQEGLWFQGLHTSLASATLHSFPVAGRVAGQLALALSYDRPDIILTDDEDSPILILERTREVPSGHNVGQRFARLVGAAKMRVPAVYFGPFKAYKHGGETQGPRYMNLRLFHAIEKMAEEEDTALTIINWPVDSGCEIIQTPDKDNDVREYLKLFFDYLNAHGMNGIVEHMKRSSFEADRRRERAEFARTDVRNPEQYDSPPPSVRIATTALLEPVIAADTSALRFTESVLYKVGMTYVRSDPYTGTALLYSYLYCGGHPTQTRNLILHFPKITIAMWRAIGISGGRKDERLFKAVADGILFADGYLSKVDL